MVWLLVVGIILFIILLAVAVLIIPIKFHTVSSKSNEILHINLAISWLILKIKYTLKDNQIEIFFFNRRIVDLISKGKTPEKKKIKEPKVTKPAAKKSRINSFIKKYHIPSRALNKTKRLVSPDNIGHITGLVGPMRKLSGEMVNTIEFRHLKIDTIYGLDDPSHTGITAGFFYAVLGSCKTRHQIRFTPDFTGPMLDWDMMAQVTFTPIKIFPPVIRFSTNRQVIRSIWGIIRC